MLERRTAAIVTTILFLAGLTATAQTIAITGGRVLTISHGVIENGTVLVENGKIAAVGRDVKIPSGAQVIDARGKVVMPGMFDAGDKLGTVE
ncbi:MAG TPA: amidohydrolase, partial [Terriglobales bacterium]|nr:amidohydrolase [Terriglobales bacterium]